MRKWARENRFDQVREGINEVRWELDRDWPSAHHIDIP